MSVAPLAARPVAADRPRGSWLQILFPPLCLLAEGLAVVAAAYAAWTLWTGLHLTPPSALDIHIRLGFGTALVVVLLTMLRNEHRLDFHLTEVHVLQRTMRLWHVAMFALIVLAFLSRRAEELSRGAVILFYVLGLVSLAGTRLLTSAALRAAKARRAVIGRRLLVVGTQRGIATFLRRYDPEELGFAVVGAVTLTPDAATLDTELHRAVDLSRALLPDDVYLAVPWAETDTIDRCVEAFLNTPTAIHLAPERVLERFDQVAIARIGAMASLELTRPLPALARALKAAFDVLGAAIGLVLLLPLFIVVALAIKLDSRGPVFFLQTRYGFNQRPFRIVKFRTMTTYADEGDVPQARRSDPRITRVGGMLRRTNIDELPQLLNVLLGQMSLVGPRPHAVPHNRAFERRIALYARRHNMRPGITGWAQVNGLRGETDTDDKMRRRLEFDLFYIDNWSMLLDVKILLRTVLSPKAYSNAY